MLIEPCYEDDEFCEDRSPNEPEGELKCATSFAVGGVGANLTNTDGITIANFLKVGYAPYQRIGRSVRCKSLRIKGSVHRVHDKSTGFLPQGNTIRIVVVLDRLPPNEHPDQQPTWNEIFSEVHTNGDQSTDLLASINPANTKRFSIL